MSLSSVESPWRQTQHCKPSSENPSSSSSSSSLCLWAAAGLFDKVAAADAAGGGLGRVFLEAVVVVVVVRGDNHFGRDLLLLLQLLRGFRFPVLGRDGEPPTGIMTAKGKEDALDKFRVHCFAVAVAVVVDPRQQHLVPIVSRGGRVSHALQFAKELSNAVLLCRDGVNALLEFLRVVIVVLRKVRAIATRGRESLQGRYGALVSGDGSLQRPAHGGQLLVQRPSFDANDLRVVFPLLFERSGTGNGRRLKHDIQGILFQRQQHACGFVFVGC